MGGVMKKKLIGLRTRVDSKEKMMAKLQKEMIKFYFFVTN